MYPTPNFSGYSMNAPAPRFGGWSWERAREGAIFLATFSLLITLTIIALVMPWGPRP